MRRDVPNGQSKTSLSPSKRDESHSSASQAEEIKFLKTKLLDTHSRLMEQLDVCKEQEKKIMQLVQANEVLKDQLEERSEGESPQVEAIKARLKAEIQEKNHFREELSFLAEKYTDLQEASKKYRNDASNDRSAETLRKKLAALETENSRLKKQVSDLQSDKVLIRQKATDLDKHVKQQRQINRGLTQENKNLQAKLFNLVIKSQSLEEQNGELRNGREQQANRGEGDKQRRELGKLRAQPRPKQRQEESVIDKKQPTRKNPRRNFDQTQQLIKRLEQAEVMTRTRNSKSINKLRKLQKQIASDSNELSLNKQLTFDQNSQLQPPRKYVRF